MEQCNWNNSWESSCDWSTYSAILLSAFCREWFRKLFPYNQRGKHLAKPFPSFSLVLRRGSLNLCSTSEAFFPSCSFSRSGKLLMNFYTTFINRMGISWICTLAYSEIRPYRAQKTETQFQRPMLMSHNEPVIVRIWSRLSSFPTSAERCLLGNRIWGTKNNLQ